MCPVGLFDYVTIAPAPAGITVTADTRSIPWDETNLAYQAAQCFADALGSPLSVSIHLEKHIPDGAGLGGGSSDAAAVLMLLNTLSGAECSLKDLMIMGASLGSDVPFFCLEGAALATGRGEILSRRVLFSSFWIVLIVPPFSISTPWAYQQVRLSLNEKPERLEFGNAIDLKAIGPSLLHNDLERAVMASYPEIDFIKQVLQKHGAWGSLMTGSGSAVFGIFFEEREALKAGATMQKKYADKGWTIIAAPALI